MSETKMYSIRGGTIIGFILEAAAFALGIWGLMLLWQNYKILVDAPGTIVPTFRFAETIAGLPVLARFVIFLLLVAAFTLIMAYMSRQFRRINRVLGALMAALSAYAYAGTVFLCSMVSGIRWPTEVAILGKFFFAIGLLIALFFVVVVGVRSERLRFLIAILFGVLSIPAQLVILFLIFRPGRMSNTLLIVGGLVLLVVDILVYYSFTRTRSPTRPHGS